MAELWDSKFHIAEQWYDKAIAQRDRKQYEKALVCFDRALALAPKESEWWYWKGVTLCNNINRYEQALACFDRALEIAADDAHSADYRAFCLFKLDRDVEALVAYDYALTLAPSSSNLWHWKGRTLSWLKRHEEALACFSRAVELAPEQARHWYWKGYTLRGLKRDEEALTCFERALACAPDHASAAKERAAALYRLQRNEEALSAYEVAITLAAENNRAEFYYWRGLVLRRLKREQEALDAFERSLEEYDRSLALDANNSAWWHERANVCSDLGRYNEALTSIEHSTTLNESDADSWFLQGVILYNLGRYQEALDAYKVALKFAPTNSQIWWNQGVALFVLRRYEEAAAAYDEALRLNPDDPELQQRYIGGISKIRRTTTDQRLKLRDGRWLGYLDYGDPDGAPIFCFHGAPGSRLEFSGYDDMLKELHLRLIAPDRPGYGLSDFQPHRRLLDWPADVEQLADHLGIERFAVLGVSAGGPHAAACAYAIPQRLTRVGLISGATPLELTPLRAYAPRERPSNFIGRYFPGPIQHALYSLLVPIYRRYPRLFLYSAYRRSMPLTAEGKAAAKSLEYPSGPLAPVIREQVLEPYRQGARGHAWDIRVSDHPWGFRLGDIHNVEVFLWQGELDPIVPVSTARALAAAIPGCHAIFYLDEGHDAYDRHTREILTTLISGGADEPSRQSEEKADDSPRV